MVAPLSATLTLHGALSHPPLTSFSAPVDGTGRSKGDWPLRPRHHEKIRYPGFRSNHFLSFLTFLRVVSSWSSRLTCISLAEQRSPDYKAAIVASCISLKMAIFLYVQNVNSALVRIVVLIIQNYDVVMLRRRDIL